MTTVDPTREAVAAALHKVACMALPSSCENDPHPYEWEQADAAVAAFLASPPDWLTALVRANHNTWCPYNRHDGRCAAVPPALRSAAGLDTP